MIMAVRRRTAAQEERELARQQEADRLAHEQAGAVAHDLGVIAPGYVRAISKINGEPVTFVGGQLLPGWAARLWRQQQPRPDEHGVYTLEGK